MVFTGLLIFILSAKDNSNCLIGKGTLPDKGYECFPCPFGSYNDENDTINDTPCTKCGIGTTQQPGINSLTDKTYCNVIEISYFMSNKKIEKCRKNTLRSTIPFIVPQDLKCDIKDFIDTEEDEYIKDSITVGPGKNYYYDCQCSKDHYIGGDHLSNYACTPCPPNQVTVAFGFGIDYCACIEGYTMNIEENRCEPCPKNFFKPYDGNSTCLRCSDWIYSSYKGSANCNRLSNHFIVTMSLFFISIVELGLIFTHLWCE
ncbi:MAG: hypothetical protein MHPSP_000958 [Paramarteilia canceri]